MTMLKDAINHLERIKAEAQAAQEEAREELDRRKKWNEDFNAKMVRLGEGGIPGFDADDPTL
jgi:hypothetical protein